MTSTGTSRHLARRLAALVAATVGLAAVGVMAAVPAAAAPPFNDNLANAAPIDVGVYGPTTAEATMETGEVAQAGCGPIAHSVWYVYTATDNQVVKLETSNGGPLVDTVINVWTSSTPGAPTIGSLQPVACDDESKSPHASVYFPTVNGTKYFIQLADYAGFTPNPGPVTVTLSKSPPPANDPLTSATPLTLGAPATNTNTEFSTLQPGEAAAADCGTPHGSVWFSWTPAADTGVDVETLGGGAGTDTLVNVYTAATPTIGDLDQVACNDDKASGNRLSKVGFFASAATTYYIQVSDLAEPGKHAPPGPVQVQLVSHALEVNNDLAGAATVGSPQTIPVDNTYTSVQTGEVQPTGTGCRAVTHSLWYRYTPERSGDLLVETRVGFSGGNPDTVLGVWSAPVSNPTFAQLTQAGCDDDISASNLRSTVTLPVSAGTYYFVQVGTYADPASFELHLASGTATALAAAATGQTVTLAATVAAISGAPTGSVEFREGTTLKATIPLSSATATLTLPGVPVGPHTYTATFIPPSSGDYLASASAERSVTSSVPPGTPPQAASTTTLTVPKKVTAGKKATVTVTVTTATGAKATGQVTVLVDGKSATVTLANGVATFTTKKLKKPAKVSVAALYTGTITTTGSTDTATIKVVRKPK